MLRLIVIVLILGTFGVCGTQCQDDIFSSIRGVKKAVASEPVKSDAGPVAK